LFKEIVDARTDGRTDGRRTPDIEGSQKLTKLSKGHRCPSKFTQDRIDLKELEHRKMDLKVLILKYYLDKSLSKEI